METHLMRYARRRRGCFRQPELRTPQMQFRLSAGSKQQNVGKYTESPLFTKLQRVFTFLGAMVSILLILIAINMTVRGTIR